MKVLVVGGGSIGKRHLKNLNVISKKEIYCLKRKPNKNFEKEFNCKVICTKDQAVKLKPKVIIVCNPTSMHAEWVGIANKINAHVFMEKPLIFSEEQLQYVKKNWDYKKVFFIGFMLRFHPLVKEIKRLIEQDKIGSVYSARLEFGSWLPYWHPWENYKTSYASIKQLGGGVINTITHELDLAQYFFGIPKKIKTLKANLKVLDIEVEEIAESIFLYEDKLISLHLDFLQKDYDRNIKIMGSNGKIIWDWHKNEVLISIHKEKQEQIKLNNFDVNELYLDELKNFFQLIKNKTLEHELDFKHACKNAELMLKMHK